MTHSSTSALARYSKVKRAVAAVAVATALFFLPSEMSGAPSVVGPPYWLNQAAERASDAVWSELIGKGLSDSSMIKTFSLVMGRLFSGYEVVVKEATEGPSLRLIPEGPALWDVAVVYPDIPEPSLSWLRSDGDGVMSELRSELVSVPYQAISWGDEALRGLVDDVISRHMPGWRGSVVVRLKDDVAILELSVFPSPPLILATYPSIYSGTLPNLLREGLRESLVKDMSPIIGLPVSWIDKHRAEVDEWATRSLERRNTVSKSDSKVSISVTPEEIARVEGTVESRRYVLKGWLSAHAGAQGRPPEFGLHLGRIVQVIPDWDWELYAEAILELEEWELESRWGVRWAVNGPLWLGVEYTAPDDYLWYRLWIKGNKKGPYLWWRYSEESENQGALGYRLNQTISLELHYDDRHDDRWSIRAVGDL